MDLTRIADPSEPIISLAEAKAQIRVLTNDEDSLISALVDTATAMLEGRNGILGRALVTQDWRQRFECWPGRGTIELAFPPLVAVLAVKYIDLAGVQQTMSVADYDVSTGTFVGCLRPAYGVSWPAIRSQPGAIEIDFRAGYGAATDVPRPLKQAALMLVHHWFYNRDAVGQMSASTMAVEALTAPYKMPVPQ